MILEYIVCRAEAGESLLNCITSGRRASCLWEMPVQFSFNGALMQIKPDTTDAEAHESYDKQIADIINKQIIAHSSPHITPRKAL